MCVLLANTHRPKSNSFASEFLRKWGPEHSLPVSGRSISLGTSFHLVHEFALLRLSIPSRAGVVINTSSGINPNQPALRRLSDERSNRSWNFLRTESGYTKEKSDQKYLEGSHRPYGISRNMLYAQDFEARHWIRKSTEKHVKCLLPDALAGPKRRSNQTPNPLSFGFRSCRRFTLPSIELIYFA